jgi:hypothetical protein
MSTDNSTMMNATLAYAQGEESKDTSGNDTGGMPEGQTDPNGEGTDLGTGGP